jgi:EpsI family protein
MSKIQISALVLLCLTVLWVADMKRIPQTSDDSRVVDDFAGIPSQIGNWSSVVDSSSVSRRQDVLPTASVLDRTYTNGQGSQVSISIVYCTSLGDLHQPEFCLGGQGWSAADKAMPILRPKNREPFASAMSWIQNEATGQESVALYWFNSRLVKDTLLPWFKMKVYWCRIRGVELESVALVRIMVPTTAGDRDRAKKAAMDFASQVSPYIDRMMSKPPVTEKL